MHTESWHTIYKFHNSTSHNNMFLFNLFIYWLMLTKPYKIKNKINYHNWDRVFYYFVIQQMVLALDHLWGILIISFSIWLGQYLMTAILDCASVFEIESDPNKFPIYPVHYPIQIWKSHGLCITFYANL